MTDEIKEKRHTYVPIISFGGIENMHRSLFSSDGQCGDTAVLSTCIKMSKAVGGMKVGQLTIRVGASIRWGEICIFSDRLTLEYIGFV